MKIRCDQQKTNSEMVDFKQTISKINIKYEWTECSNLKKKLGKKRKGEGRKPITMLFMRNKFKTIS